MTARTAALLICCCAAISMARAEVDELGELGHAADECSLDIWNSTQRYEPVLAYGQTLAFPDRTTGRLELSAGELLVACTGRRNHLLLGEGSGLAEVTASCLRGNNTLQVDGATISLDNLWCKGRSTAQVPPSVQRCGPADGFRVFEIGFNVSGRWFSVLDVCHDVESANTFYSHHRLYGSLLKHRRPQIQPRPSFQQGCESGELYPGLSPGHQFSRQSVENSLAAALGSTEAAVGYLNRSALSRGHLAPSADFILNTHQVASFFYVNAAPQWQSFNEGNWLSLETVLRNHATRHGLDLQVWTGTLGVQSLEGAELFLAKDRRLAVPRFFWKLVRDDRSGSAVAFVGLNDPFATQAPSAAELPCPDVCAQAGWRSRRANKWGRLHRGLVWCCSAEALQTASPGFPDFGPNVPLLPGPYAPQ